MITVDSFAVHAFAFDLFDCAFVIDHFHRHRTHSFAHPAVVRNYLYCLYTFVMNFVATFRNAHHRNCLNCEFAEAFDVVVALIVAAVAFDIDPFDVTLFVASLALPIHQILRQMMAYGMPEFS